MKTHKIKPTSQHVTLIILYLALAVLMSVAAVWDLNISMAIADPTRVWAKVFEIIGEPPSLLFCAFNCAILLAYYRKKSALAAGFSFAGIIIATGYTTFRTLIYIADWVNLNASSGAGFDINLVHFAICSVITAIIVFVLIKLGNAVAKQCENKMDRIARVALTVMIAALATLIVVNIFKFAWGRMRYRDILATGDLSQFTPWYLPNGINGNRSFPSGHTANALIIFTGLYYADVLEFSKTKLVLCNVGLIIWIGLVAFSRVAVGAHYLSDVVFAFAITYAIIILMQRIFLKDSRDSKK